MSRALWTEGGVTLLSGNQRDLVCGSCLVRTSNNKGMDGVVRLSSCKVERLSFGDKKGRVSPLDLYHLSKCQYSGSMAPYATPPRQQWYCWLRCDRYLGTELGYLDGNPSS